MFLAFLNKKNKFFQSNMKKDQSRPMVILSVLDFCIKFSCVELLSTLKLIYFYCIYLLNQIFSSKMLTLTFSFDTCK